jgi:hypothetical protein
MVLSFVMEVSECNAARGSDAPARGSDAAAWGSDAAARGSEDSTPGFNPLILSSQRDSSPGTPGWPE